MNEHRKALVIHEGFSQPTSVVEKFLDFTCNVFPSIITEGRKFARPDLKGRLEGKSNDFYVASTLDAKLRSSEAIGFDRLMLSVRDRKSYIPGVEKVLSHCYFLPDNEGTLSTQYYMFKGSVLAFDVMDTSVNELVTLPDGSQGRYIEGSEDYKNNQSVARAIGRDDGFERGLVDMLFNDKIGEFHERRNMHMLVRVDELNALLKLYAPA